MKHILCVEDFQFNDPNGNTALTTLNILDNEGQRILILTERNDNPAMSITTAVEAAFTAAVMCFGQVDIMIEHYPPQRLPLTKRDRDDTFDQVEMNWDDNQKVFRSNSPWSPIDDSLVPALKQALTEPSTQAYSDIWLLATMPDGITVRLPAELIAHNRATRLALDVAPNDPIEYRAVYVQQFAFTLKDDLALLDWEQDYIEWRDVKRVAIRDDNQRVGNYTRAWIDAKKIVQRP